MERNVNEFSDVKECYLTTDKGQVLAVMSIPTCVSLLRQMTNLNAPGNDPRDIMTYNHMPSNKAWISRLLGIADGTYDHLSREEIFELILFIESFN